MENKLKDHRIKSGKTQEYMAKKLDISVASYNMYENRKRKIPQKIGEEIAKILNVKYDEIFLLIEFTFSEIR